MLGNSPDDVIWQIQPEVRTGANWSAAKSVQEAEASLQMKGSLEPSKLEELAYEVLHIDCFPVRTEGTADTCPDSKVHEAYMGPTWGRQVPGGPRAGPMNLAIRVVTTEINMTEQEKRMATTAKPSGVYGSTGRELRLGNFHGLRLCMETLALLFLLCSTYNLLPIPANDKQWAVRGDDTWLMSVRWILWHGLSFCESSLHIHLYIMKTHVRGFFDTDLHEVSWHFATHEAVRPSGF